jgi:hypothetical protein
MKSLLSVNRADFAPRSNTDFEAGAVALSWPKDNHRSGKSRMDRDSFTVWCLLGMAVALAVFFTLGAKRRACIPPLLWWLCLILGAVLCMFGLFHSTAPSFATRITEIGKAYDHVERKRGIDTYYSFRFVPDGAEPVNIETYIILPDWGTATTFDGPTFRVVYLQDSKRILKNEAIDIEILSGNHAGFHDSFDARPAGAWLGIPIGAVLGAFGFFGLRYMKDDAISARDRMADDGQFES